MFRMGGSTENVGIMDGMRQRYQKGDRKIQKQVEDLMPIFRGLNKSGSPEEAAKYFLSGTYK